MRKADLLAIIANGQDGSGSDNEDFDWSTILLVKAAQSSTASDSDSVPPLLTETLDEKEVSEEKDLEPNSLSLI